MRVAPSSAVVGVALAACSPSDMPSSGNSDTICIEEGLDATSEGDETSDGCLFVPFCAGLEDEGSTDKLDMGFVPDLPCEPDCPPPPPIPAPPGLTVADWDYDHATDTYFRYASETELEEHRWVTGTILISADATVAALTNARGSFMLGIPVPRSRGDLDIHRLALRKVQTRSDTWYLTAHDAHSGPLAHAFRPEFHLYLPKWVNLKKPHRPKNTNLFVWAFGDSHGGVAIQGMTADHEFSILGPSTSLWLETPAPTRVGVLVLTPTFRTTHLDDTLDHWEEVLSVACVDASCEIDTDIPLDPGNCADCVDNDLDGYADVEDLFCQHRSDFGCDSFGDHNHRWENSKDFAMMPDIEWCTEQQQNGMPWHAEINMKAASAAGMLNAIPLALAWIQEQGLEQNVTVPDNLPTIRHRLSYCAFAEDLSIAQNCVNSADACPSTYHLGGVTHLLSAYNDDASDVYMENLWREFDQATVFLEAEGVTPKPVAMLGSVYSGNLVDGIKTVIGYSGSLGEISWGEPYRLGAMVVESEYFEFANVAHELGHTLGLGHTIDNGPPVNLGGFMQESWPSPITSLLGPSQHPTEGYLFSNQWSNWSAQIGEKTIPRPNAFSWIGCQNESDCPEPLECRFFTANTPGVCRVSL